jgi:hypothetical protein
VLALPGNESGQLGNGTPKRDEIVELGWRKSCSLAIGHHDPPSLARPDPRLRNRDQHAGALTLQLLIFPFRDNFVHRRYPQLKKRDRFVNPRSDRSSPPRWPFSGINEIKRCGRVPQRDS